MTDSNQKRIVLGVTGSIAAYKAAEIVRLLRAENVTVDVVMTAASTRFVGAATFEALSGRPVLRTLWPADGDSGFTHIDASRGADAILIAPASADFLAKLSHGMADDLLSSLCLARDCPLYVAPAMNRQMWNNPATQRNLRTLAQDGVHLIGPADGLQACGETGPGRMLEPAEIVARLARVWRAQSLAGRSVVISAGPTFEAIDVVRGIVNLSSGKMGYALASAASAAGARVTLVSGQTCLPRPPGVEFISIVSAADMLAALEQQSSHCDILIGAAAVADYRPKARSTQKLKKSDAPLMLEMVPTVDILGRIAAREDAPFCVGFAAENEQLLEHAETKRRAKRLPLIIANRVPEAFGADHNEAVLLDDAGAHPLPRASKQALAESIIDHIAALYKNHQIANGYA